MKRFLSILFTLLMIAAVFAGCAKTEGNAGGVIKKSGDKFTLGFDQDFPPYGFVGEDGNYTGFDLDLAKEVCQRNGWAFVPQPINWDSKDMELNSGTIDCIWNGFTINGREDDYAWTVPYVNNTQVVVVKADSGINTFADLAGKIVTVQTDSSAQEAIESEDHADLRASLAKLEICAEYNTAFMDLEAGAVDAIAMDEGVAAFQIAGREDTFKILDETLVSEQYGVGFKKENTALRDTVQKTLFEMQKDGTFDRIAEQWGIGNVCLADFVK